MSVIPRTEFGWAGTNHIPDAPTNKGIVVHYDGANRGLPTSEHSQCIHYWKWCREFHMDKRGWMDIGYSYGICPHGFVFTGRGYGKEQAAQGGPGATIPNANREWLSVTLMLGPDENPTGMQVAAFLQFRDTVMDKGNHGTVSYHSHFVPTDCPGDRLRDLVKAGAFSRKPDDNKPESPEEIIAEIVEGMPLIKGLKGESLKYWKKFQGENGLDKDGKIGPLTWAEILRKLEGNG